ncbi:hypothetical protein HMPREF3190_01399 [Umbribacter vaginalis]|nr:hypothetical protein HMPREF3190_01399 [Coriobacteriales bacterium DNF00809]
MIAIAETKRFHDPARVHFRLHSSVQTCMHLRTRATMHPFPYICTTTKLMFQLSQYLEIQSIVKRRMHALY